MHAQQLLQAAGEEARIRPRQGQSTLRVAELDPSRPQCHAAHCAVHQPHRLARSTDARGVYGHCAGVPRSFDRRSCRRALMACSPCVRVQEDGSYVADNQLLLSLQYYPFAWLGRSFAWSNRDLCRLTQDFCVPTDYIQL